MKPRAGLFDNLSAFRANLAVPNCLILCGVGVNAALAAHQLLAAPAEMRLEAKETKGLIAEDAGALTVATGTSLHV